MLGLMFTRHDLPKLTELRAIMDGASPEFQDLDFFQFVRVSKFGPAAKIALLKTCRPQFQREAAASQKRLKRREQIEQLHAAAVSELKPNDQRKYRRREAAAIGIIDANHHEEGRRDGFSRSTVYRVRKKKSQV